MAEASPRGPGRGDAPTPSAPPPLSDVDELGRLVNRSETEATAELALARATAIRQARYDADGAWNRKDARERLRARFTDLARCVLADAAAAARVAGTTTAGLL